MSYMIEQEIQRIARSEIDKHPEIARLRSDIMVLKMSVNPPGPNPLKQLLGRT